MPLAPTRVGRSSTPETSGISTERFRLSGTDEQGEANISELREAFRQGFVFELLDLAKPKIPIAVHVMVLNPVRYNLSEPFTLTLTPGEDNTVVSEENGIIVREITLEGTYGLTQKRARGFIGAQGGGNPLSGTDHFQALRNLFRRYSALKKEPTRAANIQLIFHALRDDDHFVVRPREFATPRDAQRTRVHYEYRITMAATAEATFSALQRRPDQTGFFDQLGNTVRDINEAFNDARAGIAEVTANLSDIRRKVGNINAIVNNAIQVVNAVGGFVSGVTQLINYPLQLVANVVEGIDGAADTLLQSVEGAAFGVFHENARSLRRISAAVDRISLFPDRFEDTTQRIEDLYEGERRIRASDVDGGLGSAPGAGGATVGSRTRVVSGSDGRLAGLGIPRGTGLRGVAVARTDSLESIATEAGTTPEAIIIINELLPPYLTASGGPGIAKPGDVLLVPSDTGGGGGDPRGVNDFLDPEEALYGIDIALDPVELRRNGKFELLINEANDPEDAGLVRGIPNVVQGTEITIGTEIGTTVFIPDLGLRRNVGSRGTTQHVLLASIALREAMLQDNRISQIESSRVVFDSSTGELTQEITPIVSGQRRGGATLILPFGRATGGSG
jgi:hypothetical protein